MKRQSIIVLAMVFCIAVDGTASADLSNGLVANYPFNGNAEDISGNNHHGTVYGASLTNDRFGNSDSAYLFNGVSDYINVPYSSAFQLPTFTLSVWIHTGINLPTVDYAYILCRGEDSSTDRAAFALGFMGENSTWGNGAMLLYEDNGDVECIYDTDYYPSLNTWTHLAATRFSDGQVNIYKNGCLLGHWDSTPVPTTNCFQDLSIGAYWKHTSGVSELLYFFPGIIDDVRIYNRALSCYEIYELYVVPVPGAFLLGSLGLTFSTWLLHRKARRRHFTFMPKD